MLTDTDGALQTYTVTAVVLVSVGVPLSVAFRTSVYDSASSMSTVFPIETVRAPAEEMANIVSVFPAAKGITIDSHLLPLL